MSADTARPVLDAPTILVLLGDGSGVLAQAIAQVEGGHVVRRVESVDQMLDLLRSEQEDAVAIVACEDPVESARTVERVRQEHPTAAVVVVAGQATAEEVEDLHSAGAHGVVVERLDTSQRIVQAAAAARRHVGELSRALQAASQSRALLEHTLLGVFLTDPAGPVLSANPAACRMLGYTEAEICALGRAGLMDTADPALEAALAHRAEHGWVHAELTMVRSDGSRFPADVTSVLFTDTHGRPRTTTLFQDVTARVNAERDLRASEHRFSVLLDSLPDPTFMKDLEGRYVYANRAWEAVSSARPEQYLGRTDAELWPQLAPHCVANDRIALETGQVVVTEDEAVLPDGRTTCIETTKAPVRNGGDEWEGVICVARDVTERRAATDALRESESRYRLLFGAVAEGVVYQAPDGQVFDANPAASRILGWSLEDMIGRTSDDPMWDTVHPDGSVFPGRDLPPMVALRTGQPQGPVRMGIRSGTDGSRRWLRVSSVPIRDPDGSEVQGVCTTFVDITDLQSSFDELTASEARFAAIVRNSPDIIFRVDRDGRIVFVSQGIHKLGYSPDALVGQSLTEVDTGQWQPERTIRAVEEVFETGATVQVEVDLPGRTVLELRIVPERINGEAAVETVLVIVRDVTEQRSLEAQLRHAQRMEAVGRLAGGVAHDFNNLLTAIRGHADFVMEAFNENDPARADVVSIRDTVDRAVGLSRQLLAFSRKQQLEPRDVRPSRLLADLTRMLNRIIGEDIDLVLEGETDRVIRVDPTQLEQIIVNLVVNARDAQPNGGWIGISLTDRTLGRREAKALGVSAKGPFVVLRVADHGTGIDPDTLDHMFEPFYTTKPEGRGTGLGLSTVYGIVRQSGGWIDVETEAGVGTTFIVGFPTVEPTEEPELPDPEAGHGGPLSGATILVVEDEEPVREVCRRALSRTGYRVLSARNGDDALDALRQTREAVDLIITDVVMPGTSGYELFRALRETAPDSCVMFMSGCAAETLAEQGIPLDQVAFISKPFDPATLRNEVAQALLRRRRRLDS